MSETDELEVPSKKKEQASPYSEVELPNTRFCGRCQRWFPSAVEIHFCKRAPRTIGYEWREWDEPAVEKNSILLQGKPFKRGALIARFSSEAEENGSETAED